MELKLIIIAVVSVIITVKVFAGAKTLPAIVGFCGVFAMLLIAVNTLMTKIN
jgi:hypothetical protein